MTNAPRTARARARAELTREIKQVARRQLALEGSAGLSLRAVARELGMVSSALYRYFPSRDELLTALIVDAYEAVGSAAADAEAGVPRHDHPGRWRALTRAVRIWALAHPQEYALIFGSPVPGYVAPQETVSPATRIPLLMLALLVDATATPLPTSPIPAATRRDLQQVARQVAPELSEAALARGLMAWSQLIGSISFELFGHLVGSIQDYPAWFDLQMSTAAESLGLA